MRSFNLDQLRTFLEVVEIGSFSGAARRLNLTQPAVSSQIRELEARCGIQLIDRVGKQVQTTAAGMDLVEHARRIMRECESMDLAMHRFHDGWQGRVHIGTNLTSTVSHVTNW